MVIYTAASATAAAASGDGVAQHAQVLLLTELLAGGPCFGTPTAYLQCFCVLKITFSMLHSLNWVVHKEASLLSIICARPPQQQPQHWHTWGRAGGTYNTAEQHRDVSVTSGNGPQRVDAVVAVGSRAPAVQVMETASWGVQGLHHVHVETSCHSHRGQAPGLTSGKHIFTLSNWVFSGGCHETGSGPTAG